MMAPRNDQIPVQPVEKPVICSPYDEPLTQHFGHGTARR